MPTVGSFHRKFWRSRNNPLLPPGAPNPWQYPLWQAVSRSAAMSLVIFGPPLDVLRPLLAQAWLRLRRAWWAWYVGLEQLTPDDTLVIPRVLALVQSRYWDEACDRVRACATSPKFHQPEAWVEYSRAIKKDIGQAQNVFRHVRVVHELKAAHPELTNPEAHLVTELAYLAVAAQGRAHRRVIDHAHV